MSEKAWSRLLPLHHWPSFMNSLWGKWVVSVRHWCKAGPRQYHSGGKPIYNIGRSMQTSRHAGTPLNRCMCRWIGEERACNLRASRKVSVMDVSICCLHDCINKTYLFNYPFPNITLSHYCIRQPNKSLLLAFLLDWRRHTHDKKYKNNLHLLLSSSNVKFPSTPTPLKNEQGMLLILKNYIYIFYFGIQIL